MSWNVYLIGYAIAAALSASPVYQDANDGSLKSPFTGRWRMDMTSLKGEIKPTVIKLRDNKFKKNDGVWIDADGKSHPTPKDVYVDEQSITIESKYVVKEIDKFRGKTVYTVKYTVSADGNTLTSDISSFTSPNGEVVKSQTVERRVGRAAKGEHLISGTWERASVTIDAKSDWIITLDGNKFSWRTEGGVGYSAIIGGDPVKIDGDNAGDRAQISMPKPNLIIETDSSVEGKQTAILKMEVLDDKRTMLGTAIYNEGKTSNTFYLHKVEE